MVAKLVAEEGQLKGLVVSLENGNEWVIGRDPAQCQITLEDPSASRRHILCRNTPDGIILENLSETNPTLINEQPISQPTLLHQGDVIKIGDGMYRYYSEEAPAITDLITETKKENGKPRNSLFEENASDNIHEALADVNLDLSDTAPWMLKVVSGPNNGAQFSMHADTSYVIGTDPSTCDIVFQDISVSRQHARISISQENVLSIEDLQSSNGTMIENRAVKGRQTFAPNTLISTGTTSFVLFDKQGERQTIISPLLPAIVKLLQEEQEKKISERLAAEPQKSTEMPSQEQKIISKEEKEAEKNEPHGLSSTGSLILVSILTGIFLFVGLGTAFLFHEEDIEKKAYNVEQELSGSIGPYPSVKYSFNPASGRLVLVGHVLTTVDRDQLMHDLKVFPFIRSIDNNIIVDENIWQETNQVLSKNPQWKGVAIHSPSAGKFVISGYLQNSKQLESLSNYLSQNFPYLELLEQKIVVEEELMNRTNVLLKDQGFNAVTSKVNNGELILSGDIPFGDRPALNTIVDQIKTIPGVRDVKIYINELPPQDTLVNITNQYQVSGSLDQGNGKRSVIINGQFLSEGDSLDGKLITKIDDTMIMLEAAGVKYRIDYTP